MTDWSNEQQNALKQVSNWLRGGCGDKQVFRLFGYAGTGKTTMARQIAEDVGGRVAFGAFTGKAAHVLTSKGCPARTIHSWIYVPSSKSRERLKQLQEELDQTDSEQTEKIQELKTKITEEEEALARPAFALNTDSELRYCKLLIIDECSMVNEQMGRDLLSFEVPILVLGDPAQLPPVYGAGFFTQANPDLMLTEIHRQARENPIVRLATDIREGRRLTPGQYGESRVIQGRPDPELVMGADQVLVGKNKTRRACNHKMRRLHGYQNGLPEPGDRLVCLRNDHDVGLLNGTIWTVQDAQFLDEDQMGLTVLGEEGTPLDVVAHTHHFQGRPLSYWQRMDAQEFDFGYALTTHKAQGSQWDDVLVFDESRCFGQEARNWLYTAVTRAAERVTVAMR